MFSIICILACCVLSFAMSKGYGRDGKFPQLGTPKVALEGAQVTGKGNAAEGQKSTGKGTLKDKFMKTMAIYKTSGVGVTAISGKIGGTVFNAGGSAGKFLRNWAKPANIRSAAQTLVRGLFAGVSSAFRTLTPSQVAGWNANANPENPNSLRKNAFGDSSSMSGAQLQQSVNNEQISIGLSALADCPGSAATDAVLGIAITSSAGGPTLTIDTTLFSGGVALPANTYMKIFATPQRSNGRTYSSKSALRFIGFFSPADSTVAMDIYTEYNAKFGTLVAGQKLTVAGRLIYSDGTSFGRTGLVYSTTNVGA